MTKQTQVVANPFTGIFEGHKWIGRTVHTMTMTKDGYLFKAGGQDFYIGKKGSGFQVWNAKVGMLSNIEGVTITFTSSENARLLINESVKTVTETTKK